MIGRAISFGSATINDHANQPFLWAQSPWYFIYVDNIDGIWGADISYESHPVPFAIGEVSGDVYRRGKSITITGKIRGLNMQTLEQGADYLGAMFAPRSIQQLKWTRHADNVQVYIACRVNNDLSIVENVQSGRYEWPYTVGLRADDPRIKRVSDGSVYPSWQQ